MGARASGHHTVSEISLSRAPSVSEAFCTRPSQEEKKPDRYTGSMPPYNAPIQHTLGENVFCRLAKMVLRRHLLVSNRVKPDYQTPNFVKSEKTFMKCSTLFALFIFSLRRRKRVRDKYLRLLTKEEAKFFKVVLIHPLLASLPPFASQPLCFMIGSGDSIERVQRKSCLSSECPRRYSHQP